MYAIHLILNDCNWSSNWVITEKIRTPPTIIINGVWENLTGGEVKVSKNPGGAGLTNHMIAREDENFF